MAFNTEDKRLSRLKGEEEDSTGSGSTTGTSGGEIEFRTFIGNERSRDDLLPADEKRRLLAVHQTHHEESVKKQKARFEEYQRLKEGKINLQEFRHAANQEFQFKPHTILANKAQFSGSDRQVSQLPNEQNSDANNDKKNELHYQYRLENRPQYTNAPKAAPPKPSPFG